MEFYSLYNCFEAYFDIQERTCKFCFKDAMTNLEHKINSDESKIKNQKHEEYPLLFSLTEYYYDFGHR